jgi:hypothetical protein
MERKRARVEREEEAASSASSSSSSSSMSPAAGSSSALALAGHGLPPSVQLDVMASLGLGDLGHAAMVSRRMQSLVRSHLESTHHLSTANRKPGQKEHKKERSSSLALLTETKNLVKLEITDDKEIKANEAAPMYVTEALGRSAATLKSIRISEQLLLADGELIHQVKLCPKLESFVVIPFGTEKKSHWSRKWAIDVVRHCVHLTELGLPNDAADVLSDPNMLRIGGPRLRSLILHNFQGADMNLLVPYVALRELEVYPVIEGRPRLRLHFPVEVCSRLQVLRVHEARDRNHIGAIGFAGECGALDTLVVHSTAPLTMPKTPALRTLDAIRSHITAESLAETLINSPLIECLRIGVSGDGTPLLNAIQEGRAANLARFYAPTGATTSKMLDIGCALLEKAPRLRSLWMCLGPRRSATATAPVRESQRLLEAILKAARLEHVCVIRGSENRDEHINAISYDAVREKAMIEGGISLPDVSRKTMAWVREADTAAESSGDSVAPAASESRLLTVCLPESPKLSSILELPPSLRTLQLGTRGAIESTEGWSADVSLLLQRFPRLRNLWLMLTHDATCSFKSDAIVPHPLRLLSLQGSLLHSLHPRDLLQWTPHLHTLFVHLGANPAEAKLSVERLTSAAVSLKQLSLVSVYPQPPPSTNASKNKKFLSKLCEGLPAMQRVITWSHDVYEVVQS